MTTLGEKARAAAFRRLREHWAHRAIAIMLLMMTVLIFGEKDREWLVSLIESFSGGRGQAAFHDLVTPSSGEQVLPPAVRDMLALLRKNDIKEYALSPQISADPLLHQRIVESAFPRKMLPRGTYLLALPREELPARCSPLANEEEAQVAACN